MDPSGSESGVRSAVAKSMPLPLVGVSANAPARKAGDEEPGVTGEATGVWRPGNSMGAATGMSRAHDHTNLPLEAGKPWSVFHAAHQRQNDCRNQLLLDIRESKLPLRPDNAKHCGMPNPYTIRHSICKPT